MGRRRGAAVVVRTSAALTALLVLTGVATAQPAPTAPTDAAPTDADIIGTDPGWRVETADLRVAYLTQDGHGYQSQDGPTSGPGSEAMWLIEPWGHFRIRQNRRVVHEVTIPVDIVTAASADAVDAVSTASLRNVAADIDVRTSIQRSDVTTLTTRVAAHVEEPLSSGTVGAGWRRSLADDNAQLSLDGSLTIDGFDRRDQTGRYYRKSSRGTASLNVGFAQLLSPTTAFDASYGITQQWSTLAQTWNAVPVDGAEPDGERLPRARLRQAASARIAQRVPLTNSTLKARYRYYRDDFEIVAHTVDAAAYQYLTPWLVLRLGARFHRQTAAAFFTTGRPAEDKGKDGPVTADSDLAAFDARELSAELMLLRAREPRGLRAYSFSAEVLRYWRTNDLHITAVALSIGRAL